MFRNRRVTGRVFVSAVWLVIATLVGVVSPAASTAYAAAQDEADHVYFVLAVEGMREGGFVPDRANMVRTLEGALKEQGLEGRYSFKIIEAEKVGPGRIETAGREEALAQRSLVNFPVDIMEMDPATGEWRFIVDPATRHPKQADWMWDVSNDVTDSGVMDTLRALKPQPNDTIVFYYTGHGGFFVEKGHYLWLRRWEKDGRLVPSDLYRKDVLAAMLRYPHRASIVLTDCCANAPSTQVVTDPVGAQPNRFPDNRVEGLLAHKGHGEVVRDLFFRSRGIVNITASRTGTTSSYWRPPAEEGRCSSHFTNALCTLLKVDRGAFLTADRGGFLTVDRGGLHVGEEGAVPWEKLFRALTQPMPGPPGGEDRVVRWDDFFPQLEKLTGVESYKHSRSDPKTFHTPEKFMAGPARFSVGQVPPTNPILSMAVDLDPRDPLVTTIPWPGQDPKGTHFYHKVYPVKMSKAKAYLISLHSAAFDTYVYVKDTQLQSLLAWNHDADDSVTRSRIVFFPPWDGQYFVGVTSYGAEGTGRFSLTVEESLLTDQLTQTDPLDRFCYGAFSKAHPVQLTAFRHYTVRLISQDTKILDPYLRVEDEFGDTIALNDDEKPGVNLNSRVTFHTQTTGTYYIVATSFDHGKTGRYAVFVQE